MTLKIIGRGTGQTIGGTAGGTGKAGNPPKTQTLKQTNFTDDSRDGGTGRDRVPGPTTAPAKNEYRFGSTGRTGYAQKGVTEL